MTVAWARPLPSGSGSKMSAPQSNWPHRGSSAPPWACRCMGTFSVGPLVHGRRDAGAARAASSTALGCSRCRPIPVSSPSPARSPGAAASAPRYEAHRRPDTAYRRPVPRTARHPAQGPVGRLMPAWVGSSYPLLMTESGEPVSTRRDDIRRRVEERYRRLQESRRLKPRRHWSPATTKSMAAPRVRWSHRAVHHGHSADDHRLQLYAGLRRQCQPRHHLHSPVRPRTPLKRTARSLGPFLGAGADWRLIGVARFLVWGIPMSVSVAGIFAKAWRREQYGLLTRLVRGTSGSSSTWS